MKKLCIWLALLAALTLNAAAQERKPSTAKAELKVMRATELSALEKKLQPKGKQNLVEHPSGQTVMYYQHERDTLSEAEVHDAADDYHFVIEGEAAYTLGGKLEGSRETKPGEWRGGQIVGGQRLTLKKGDVIFVPRGTPHQRDTRGQKVSLQLIKIYARPGQWLEPSAPAPSTPKP